MLYEAGVENWNGYCNLQEEGAYNFLNEYD